tara:strand:- start:2323 stop:2664 length:342 start_codon:yes stop_codon:yes gene_type:complete
MKAIFKIEEYLPETNQIVVRFARLHAPKLIENYTKVAVDCNKLDYHDSESFVQSLMTDVGDYMVKSCDDKEPIINKAEKISGELNLRDLVGKVVECKVDNRSKKPLRMRKIEL